ncbi:uncharacterized protein LOC113352496 [Papaver somniferum]|uniref:uncharacterized protein LOC113352496 n=1 Tax=Papaver somniferum TaxID=3469 RepID=UPI000E704F83|nr:uncharacterized protein LOC113352496 [Papaver somniferum]
MYNKLNEKTINNYNLGQLDSFWKHLWALEISQRIKIFTWKCLQNAVSTNLKLSRFKKDITPTCTFGCMESESIEHLFLHCSFAKAVWTTNPYPVELNFNNSTTFLDVCKEWICKDNPTIHIEIIMTKIWFIWKGRCNRTFGKQQQSHNQLALEIQRHLVFWHKDKYTVHTRSTNVGNSSNDKWQAPGAGQDKITLDAAWISIDVLAGFSLIFRNAAGNFEQGKARPITDSSP